MEVNAHVIKPFPNIDPFANLVYATPSCLSVAQIALWTNRVPEHEPWPRVLKGDTENKNEKTDEYKKNVHHHDQYDNETSPKGREPIGKVEGDEVIKRGPLWLR